MLTVSLYTRSALIILLGFSSVKHIVTVAPNKIIKVPLTKINNNYYGYIVVGTPTVAGGHNQIFRVNFDTGSQHLWLISTENCPTPACKNVKYTPFNKKKSSTFTQYQNRFVLGYTDGTIARGQLGADFIQLGLGDATVKIKQTIGFASKVEGIMEDCDGIFGLGLLSTHLFPGNPDPPMVTLEKQHGISEFGIYFSRKLNGDNAGMLVFGGHDESLVQGQLQWHDVVKVKGLYEGYMIKFDKIIVQKGTYKKTITFSNMLALPDSGNNVIVGPKDIFDNIKDDIMKHATFPYNKDYHSFDCKENVKVLPNLIFVMDGRQYTMYPKDYIWTLKSGKRCRLGIFGMDFKKGKDHIDHIVLGQIFMQTFYSKFSFSKKAVGFARAKHLIT